MGSCRLCLLCCGNIMYASSEQSQVLSRCQDSQDTISLILMERSRFWLYSFHPELNGLFVVASSVITCQIHSAHGRHIM
ncbi:hypothetical protein GDO81_011128 [Engystomops pustulosus]|uniref:Secreted protein n=1 Tax=Engystomops pustulosus TaxID=76066 RepID=A0AAV7BC83_ENGPU|nr:hypothetical protein GDO81_011128 [Engystomops pustulosus]